MATTFSSFRTPIVSSLDYRRPDQDRKKAAQPNAWSSEPDYISIRSSNAGETGRVRPDRSFFMGCFTEEKAKELRRKTMETSTFHDIMYHSAIASRLASDLSPRSDL